MPSRRKKTTQPRDRPSFPGKQAINRHLYHHHGKRSADTHDGEGADLPARLAYHDELHWKARTDEAFKTQHTHLPYQEGETDNEMAFRMLRDGNTGEGTSVPLPEINGD